MKLAKVGLLGWSRDEAKKVSAVLTAQGVQWFLNESPDALGLLLEEADVILLRAADAEEGRLSLLELIHGTEQPLPVVVVMSTPRPEEVMAAARLGAVDVLFDAGSDERLLQALTQAVALGRARKGGDIIQQACVTSVLGESPRMLEVFKQIGMAASTQLGVLLTGETGVGKEVAAHCIHKHSARAGGPFVAINCAALTDSLLEAELFGHARGAFTGSIRDVAGKVEIANGGTLMLDEIGDMALDCQAVLLRFLEDRKYYRIGDSRPRTADVRIVAATNRNLVAEVAAGRFREDLYYRLAQLSIYIPPLRERLEDIPLLIRAFVAEANASLKLSITKVNPEAEQAARAYAWPGNVRELRNTVFQAVIQQRAGVIDRFEFMNKRGNDSAGSAMDLQEVVQAAARSGNVRSLLDDFEAMTLKALLSYYDGNRSRISTELGISRNTLRAKLRDHGLDQTG